MSEEFERLWRQLSEDEQRQVRIYFEDQFPGVTVILTGKRPGGNDELISVKGMWLGFKHGYVRGKQVMALKALDVIKEITE